jgi:hypothetical protein
MAKLDAVLEKYDLKSIEAAVARRRRREVQDVERLSKKREHLTKQVKELENRRRKIASGLVVERKPNARRLNDISLADAIEQVMRRRRGPIHYKDLTDTIARKRLYVTKSRNLLSTVAVTLKRDERFKKVSAGMYGLA